MSTCNWLELETLGISTCYAQKFTWTLASISCNHWATTREGVVWQLV